MPIGVLDKRKVTLHYGLIFNHCTPARPKPARRASHNRPATLPPSSPWACTARRLGPTLPGLAAQTGSGLSQISILFSARAFGYLVGSVATGRLYDRLSGNRVMAVMLASHDGRHDRGPGDRRSCRCLWVVFLFLGITEAGVDVGGNTLIVWRHGARVGPFMNAMHFCYRRRRLYCAHRRRPGHPAERRHHLGVSGIGVADAAGGHLGGVGRPARGRPPRTSRRGWAHPSRGRFF